MEKRRCFLPSFAAVCSACILVLLVCAPSCSRPPAEPHEEKQAADETFLGPDWADLSNIEVPAQPSTEQAARYLERGAYLAQAAAACGGCHGKNPADPDSPLSGGRLMHDAIGVVRAPNITPDPETGIGSWNLAEIARAIRAAIGKGGSRLSLDLHRTYRWMSDEDAMALAFYLRSLPPVRREVERRKTPLFAGKKWGLFDRHSEIEGYVPAMTQKEIAQYGRYLTWNVSGCRTCHTPQKAFWSSPDSFSGAKPEKKGLFGLFRSPAESDFPYPGPDIRGTSATGLQLWKADDIVEYLSTGRTIANRQVSPLRCPWTYFRNMTESDKRAVALYLKRQ